MNRRLRTLLVVVLIVLGCVAATLSVAARWTRSVVLDTDRYVQTVAPLASDPDIQDAIAQRVTEEILTALDLETNVGDALDSFASSALPPAAQALVPAIGAPIVSAVESFVTTRVDAVVRSDAFATAWESANRGAHETMVTVLTDEGSDVVEVEGGTVRLDLAAFVQAVKANLLDRGFQLAERIPDVTGEFVLLQNANLDDARAYTRLLDRVATFLPSLALALLAAGIWLARSRRRALMWAAVGVGMGALAILVARRLGRSWFLDAVPDSTLDDAGASALWLGVTQFLALAARAVLVLALVVLVGALVAGPWRWAVALRRWIAVGRAKLGLLLGGQRLGRTDVARLVDRHIAVLRTVIAVAAVLVLAAWSYPTGRVVLWTAVVAGLVWFVVEAVAATTVAEDSDAGTTDDGGGAAHTLAP